MAGSGGPWGGGGGNGGRGDDDDRPGGRGGRRPGEGPQIPEIEEIMRKGTEQLKVLMGGRGGRSGGNGGGSGGGMGPHLNRGTLMLGALAAVGLWAYASFYTVKPEEQSVELLLGKFHALGQPGLNFAPWPFVSANVIAVTPERTEDIGVGRAGQGDSGLMPAANVMNHPKATHKLEQFGAVSFGQPVAPGGADIFDIQFKRRQRGLLFGAA